MMKTLSGLVLLLFFAIGTNAWAHPPLDIRITFDVKTKILQAVIVHKVSNPAKHYINKIDVELNGKKILSQLISRQDNYYSQIVRYLIPDAIDGDVLSVEGYCSISGKLKSQIMVARIS